MPTLEQAEAAAAFMAEAVEQGAAAGVTDTAAAPAAPAQDWRIIPSTEMTADLAVKYESQGAMCLIEGVERSTPDRFMNHNMSTYCNRSAAEFVTPSRAWNRWGSRSGYNYHFLMPEPLPDGKKCRIEHQFSPSFLELVKDAPDNPIVRAHIMRILKIGVPKDIVGYEPVKDWVEKNFSAPVTRSDPGRSAPPQPTFTMEGRFNTPPPRPVDNSPFIEVVIDATEEESGTCHYLVTNIITHRQKITLEWLRSEIANEGASWDNLMEAIMTEADDQIRDGTGTGDWGPGDYEYRDYSMSDTDNYDSGIRSREQAEQDIRRFLTAQDDTLLEALDGN